MNIYPDVDYFKQQLEQTAKRKHLAVFEDNGTVYVVDEVTGAVAVRPSLSAAAAFVNSFGWPGSHRRPS
jgi:hypothetical protein